MVHVVQCYEVQTLIYGQADRSLGMMVGVEGRANASWLDPLEATFLRRWGRLLGYQ